MHERIKTTLTALEPFDDLTIPMSPSPSPKKSDVSLSHRKHSQNRSLISSTSSFDSVGALSLPIKATQSK